MSEVKRFEYEWAGRPLVIEIGEVAKQANGSVLIRYGDTVILSVAVVSKTCKVLSDFGSFNLLWSKIDLTDPVNINNPLIDDDISIDKTEYEIKIYDSVDNKIYDVVSGIKIY